MNKFLCILMFCSTAAFADVIPNGSFEDGVEPWISGPYLPASVSQKYSIDGKCSLLIKGEKSEKMVGVYQDIGEIKPGFYKAESDIFIENFSAGLFYPLYFQTFTKNGIKYPHRTIYPNQVGLGWHHFEMWLDLTEVKRIRPMIISGPKFTGEIYVDRITLNPYCSKLPLVTVPKGGGAMVNNLVDKATGKLASETTELMLHHDGDKLYISGVMSAYALDPVSNQTDSFKAVHTQRDAPVWEDDSVEIRFRNPAGNEFYFGFNAAGALIDMRRESSSVKWDKKWNAAATLRSWKENGRYCAELAIDLASIGFKPNENWNFNVVRFDKRLNKTYIYVQSDDHENLDRASLLLLGENAFNLKIPVFTESVVAARSFSIPVPAWQVVNLKDDIPIRITSGRGPSIDLGPDGGNRFALMFSDDSKREFWRTPTFYDVGKAATGTLKVTGASRPTCNGQLIGNDGKFSLIPGENILSVTAAPGDNFSTELIIGQLKLVDSAGWEQQGNTFRRTLLREATALLPNRPDGIWQLTQGNSYQLSWPCGTYAEGKLPMRPLKDFSLVVDYPESLELCGVATSPRKAIYYIKESEYPRYTVEPLPSNGLGRKRCRISLDKAITLSGIPKDWQWRRNRSRAGCHFIFRALGKPRTKGVLYVHAEAENGQVIEMPNRVDFEIFPTLNAPALKYIQLAMRVSTPDLTPETFTNELQDTLRAAGVNVLHTNHVTAHGKKIGLRQASFFYLTRNFFMPEDLKENSEFAKDFSNPARYRRTSNIDKILDRAVNNWIKCNPNKEFFMWDYEFGPFGTLYTCHTPYGYQIFAEKYGIKEPITLELLKEKYTKEWIEFSANEVGEMLSALGRALRRAGMPFLVYSGYQSPNTRKNYSIDWSKIAGVLDHAYCGYGHDPKLIEDTRFAMNNKNMVLGLLKSGTATQTDSAAAMLRKIVTGRAGVLLWYENLKDARSFIELERCAKLLGKCEKLIALGKRNDGIIRYAPEFRDSLAVFTLEGRSALLLFNEKADPLTIKYEFQGKNFSYKLPPAGIELIFL